MASPTKEMSLSDYESFLIIQKSKNSLAFMLLVFWLAPLSASAGEDAKQALAGYLNGGLPQLESLLTPDFHYQYFEKNKLKTLTRDDDFKSVARLFNDVRGNSVDSIHLIARDDKNRRKFHVKLSIAFEDSPKVYTDSFFRGDVLEIDEILIVTFEKNKISRIVEEGEKRNSNELSLGKLKSIYSKNVAIEVKENGRIFRLIDVGNNKLLIWKKLRKGEATEYFYYWPDSKRIENFFYP